MLISYQQATFALAAKAAEHSTFGFSFASKAPVLNSIHVSEWCAGPLRTAMHSTAFFSGDRGRLTSVARAGPRTATCSGKHWYDVALVGACHRPAFVFSQERLLRYRAVTALAQ